MEEGPQTAMGSSFLSYKISQTAVHARDRDKWEGQAPHYCDNPTVHNSQVNPIVKLGWNAWLWQDSPFLGLKFSSEQVAEPKLVRNAMHERSCIRWRWLILPKVSDQTLLVAFMM